MGDQWTAGARAASGRLPIKAVQALERIAEALDVDVEEPIPQSCEAGALRRSGCAGSAIVHGYRRERAALLHDDLDQQRPRAFLLIRYFTAYVIH